MHLGHGGEVDERLRFVHQDLGLVLELSAMDNLALRRRLPAREAAAACIGASRRRRRDACSRASASSSTSTARWRRRRPSSGPWSPIAAALQGWHGGRGVLVLDEPTAVLPHDEVERLFEIVREVRRAGTSVIYVSHRLDEIFELADRVTVLRGGRLVTTLPVAERRHHEARRA